MLCPLYREVACLLVGGSKCITTIYIGRKTNFGTLHDKLTCVLSSLYMYIERGLLSLSHVLSLEGPGPLSDRGSAVYK